jgi:hypothetical protein
MNTDKDIKICNAALYKYVRKNMPHYFDNRFPSSTDGFLTFFGIGSPRDLVLGGRRRTGKRAAKRVAKRVAKKKAPKQKGKKPSRKRVASQSSSSAKSSF